MNAFIGLLYHAEMWKANHVDPKQLWSHEEGYNLFRCTMPLNRFYYLSKCLRFDDKSKRSQGNKFACIEEIWNIFIERCHSNYEAHKLCTVDEQLLGFRGKCPFRVYIKSKPDKYGIKIVTLNDAENSYLINAIPYKGKIQVKDGLIPEYLLRKVTEPIHGTHHSVTCDSWFTTIPLIEKMQKQPYDLTITGTIRSNKKEIPLEMKIAGEERTAKYCHHDSITLVSWTPKKKKKCISGFFLPTIYSN
ncbi:GSCOCG00012309001-RA-CDS [Cotesia congregata]|nr:GSCOCG00012309001-RA-CDS [Cotesia congregata]